MRIATIVIGTLAVVALTAGPASAQLAAAYNVTNIGQLPNGPLGAGIAAWGNAMSNSGTYVTGIGMYPFNPTGTGVGFNQDVGMYYNGSAVSPILASSPLRATQLDGWTSTNNEFPVPTQYSGEPTAVNNSGVVVGQYNGNAFYSTQGGILVPITGFPDGIAPMAFGINDNGLIVGDWDTNNPGYAGFTYTQSAGVTSLPFAAFGVNDKGEIVGCVNGGLLTGPGSAYGEWQDASGGDHDISGLVQALAIDSSGTYICGQGQDSLASPSLYNTKTGLTVQVAPGNGNWLNAAFDVNSSGVVVGSMTASNGASPRAFVYAGGPADSAEYIGNLNLIDPPSGVTWNIASAINDAGDILVQGSYPGGPNESTFILTPVATPEPSTLLLAAAGLVGLLAYAWRKRK